MMLTAFLTLFGCSKEEAEKAREKTEEVGAEALETTKEVGGKAFEKTKEVGGKALDKTKQVKGEALERAREAGSAVQKAGETLIESAADAGAGEP